MTAADVMLSVVIPVRNGMPYLKETVESVLADLPDDAEVIVRDNFSTDGTLDWLRGLSDPRVRVVEAATPDSAGQNWTAVCELARGQFVKLVCADDFVTPGGIRRQLAAISAAPSAVLVASRRDVINDAGHPVVRGHGLTGLRGPHSGPDASKRTLRSGGNAFGEPSSVMFRGDALRASLPFTEEFPYLTDLDMYLRVLRSGSFIGLDTVDAVFRLSSGGWSQQLGNKQYEEIRRWLAHVRETGGLELTRSDISVIRVKTFARFLARRVINGVAPLFRLSRPRSAAGHQEAAPAATTPEAPASSRNARPGR